MATEQPQTSPDTESVDETTSAPLLPSSERGRSDGSPSWWARLMGRGQTEETGTTPDEDAEAAAEGKASTVTLPVEELERRVQAETDRREAKRKAQADVEAKRKLRDEDPWSYAEQERQQEQVAQQNDQVAQLFTGVSALHDGVTLDPIINSLTDAERTRILGLEGAGVGLDGRKLIVDEALKALEKHWRAEGAKDAEAKLRRNGSFRKQVLAEFGGDRSEPEQVPNGSYARPRSSSQQVNDLFRQQLGMRTSDQP